MKQRIRKIRVAILCSLLILSYLTLSLSKVIDIETIAEEAAQNVVGVDYIEEIIGTEEEVILTDTFCSEVNTDIDDVDGLSEAADCGEVALDTALEMMAGEEMVQADSDLPAVERELEIGESIAGVIKKEVIQSDRRAGISGNINLSQTQWVSDGIRENEITLMQKVQQKATSRSENNLLTGAMPCRGEAHILIIDLIYGNNENELSSNDIEDMLFGDYCSYGSSVRNENLTEYFSNVSYGKFHISGEVVPHAVNTINLSHTMLKSIMDEVFDSINPADFDCNEDCYFDGVYFFMPDQLSIGTAVEFWNYQREQYKSATYVSVGKTGKTVGTIAHETVHQMGLPDIYANVSVNASGTHSLTIMDGMNGTWNSERGYVWANIPGIMKFFFGWIDNLVEVYQTGHYELRSYSKYPEAMVIYPNGDTDNSFVFFIELVTPYANDAATLYDYNILQGGGGLRVWRVKLNLDDDYSIKGNSSCAGCGNTPYVYIDTLNTESVQNGFGLHPGDIFGPEGELSSSYFVSLEHGMYQDAYTQYTYQGVWPTGYIPSGITISNIDIEGNSSVCDIAVEPTGLVPILFIANNGSGKTSFQVVQSGVETNLSPNTFEYSGHEFAGWNSEENGTGVWFYDEQPVSIAEDLKLYAQWGDSIEWGEPTYTWAEDNTTVTAIRINLNNEECVETETVAVTGAITLLPTCITNGETTYTSAAFENEAFAVQTKVLEDVPALGHEWSNTTYSWSDDNTTVTATRICSRDEGHIETEMVTTTLILEQAPTEAEGGKASYIATFVNPAFEEQKKPAPDIPALNALSLMRLPSMLKEIGAEAFTGLSCEGIIIPEGCTSIGSRAFAGCSKLVYVRIPGTVTYFADDAFEDCPNVVLDREGM